MIRNIFEIPIIIKNRFKNYVVINEKWVFTLESLLNFIRWYQYWALDWEKENDILVNIDKWKDFELYIILKTVWYNYANNNFMWIYKSLLKVSDNDEEKAFDLFFKLLDEFIEKEWIKIDI